MLKKYFIILITIILILSYCATTPTNRVWRPWTQTMKSSEPIQLGVNFNIKIKGIANPLLGNEDLLNEELSKILKYLLERRGFFINDNNYDYEMFLTYKTENYQKNKSNSISIMSHEISSLYGLGVNIAQAMGSSVEIKTEYSYTHTVSIEMFKKDKIIWKGDTIWDSFRPDIQSEIMASLQLILSKLPSDPDIIPKVSKIKESHIKNYYLLKCKDNYFSCPALPYKIFFYNSEIDNPYALDAYVNLIQTAEYVIPIKKKINKIKNPLEKSVWKKVQLGSKYYLEPDNTPVNILINLEAYDYGYVVDKCWIAQNEEFESFKKNLNEWQKILMDYYNVFVK